MVTHEQVNSALRELSISNPDERIIANEWGKRAVNGNLLSAGPILSTYKSTWDWSPGDFSVSQRVPDLPQFVIHAHITADNIIVRDGGVNLKYFEDERGESACNIPSTKVDGLIDIDRAMEHWNDRKKEDEYDAQFFFLSPLLSDKYFTPATAAGARKRRRKRRAKSRQTTTPSTTETGQT